VVNDLHSGATLKFSADPRLAAAAAGVARYLADSAGMEADASAKLQAATLSTCVAEFPYLRGTGAQLSVDVSRFADRIEIVVADSRTAGQHGRSLPGVDKIEHETQGGLAITRLTKFIAQS
jgi:hypothetical protein